MFLQDQGAARFLATVARLAVRAEVLPPSHAQESTSHHQTLMTSAVYVQPMTRLVTQETVELQ